MAKIIVRPQDGFQMKFLSTPADIAIGGSAAGVGKSFALLLEPLRNIRIKGFGAVIFRRTGPQIRSEGGLWDTSKTIYPHVGGIGKESTLEWEFGNDISKLKFSHLEYEKNIYDWQGAQIPFIGFDELAHFTKTMFFYLLSRNRSTCGVAPYVRATCNPEPDSWLAEFLEWWIDQKTGFPIAERDGVLRWMLRDGDNFIWGDTMEEVAERGAYLIGPQMEQSGLPARAFIKSVTFISGSIYDNKKLLEIDPGYLGNLLAQDEQTRSQLLYNNWKIVVNENDIYDYSSFVGMFDNVYEVESKGKYITADIALEGSNKFVVGYWRGFELADLLIMDKSSGPEVIQGIVDMAKKYKVPNSHIIFDNDGVGGFVEGYIPNSVPFNNGAPPVEVRMADGKKAPENYEHLKAQCYYRSGARVAKGEYKVSAHVSSMMYDQKSTVRQQFLKERRAIKKAKHDPKKDVDGKLKIIKKAEMKTFLDGNSPDLMDMFMMREFPELAPKKEWLMV